MFVDDLTAPELGEDDRHHLERVLRVRPDESIVLGDGQGSWCVARFGPSVEPAGPIVTAPPVPPELTVAFAPVKGERPEWAVQKLTELGVDRLVPFVAERSVVSWRGERATRQLERYRRIAREAARQCRRVRLPVVEPLTTFADVVTRPGVAGADPGGSAPGLEHPVVLVGPEGGWSDAERAALGARVDLGPTVLRAETAAVVAATLLTGLRAGLVAPARPRSDEVE